MAGVRVLDVVREPVDGEAAQQSVERLAHRKASRVAAGAREIPAEGQGHWRMSILRLLRRKVSFLVGAAPVGLTVSSASARQLHRIEGLPASFDAGGRQSFMAVWRCTG